MNAKKITSLVLAAIMAAGTTVTAFAETLKTEDDLSVIPGVGFYTMEDGILVWDEDQQVAPGTDIYIPLQNNGDLDGKDNRYNAYAEWKVGEDSVEGLEVVYKKGALPTGKIEFKVGNFSLTADDVNGIETAILLEYQNNASFKTYIDGLVEGMKKDSGYTYNSTWSEGVPAGLELIAAGEGYHIQAANSTAAKDVYYSDADFDEFKSDFFTGTGITSIYTMSGVEDDLAGYGVVNNTLNPYYNTAISSVTGYVVSNEEASGVNDFIAPTATFADLTSASLYTMSVTATSSDVFVDEQHKDVTSNVTTLTSSNAVYVDGTTVLANVNAAKDAVVKDLVAQAVVDNTAERENEYTYWIKIDTVEDKTTKLLDLAGTLYIGSNRSSAEKTTGYVLDTTMSNRVESQYYNVVDDVTIEANSNGAVKFTSDAEDVVIYFGDNEAAWYEFDARGQSALNFEWNMDFNREIADLFPKANIDFISWVAEPSTNRTGDLWITADADTFIYEVTEDGVKEIANAEYDEDEEAWHIRTRKLTAYAISDRELDTSVTLDGEDNTSSSNTSNNGGKDNPDTGR